ncbi:PIN domain-containing protein [Deinococcus antarcticus]|uniref:PIN domain-containing protein n=1 Tax=Deinococcus antarcticus TaxID=1298767 RepID=A0ABV8AAG0_9DEIO
MTTPSRLVVDTNIVSYIYKEDTRGPLYASHLKGHSLILSFQSLAELDVWARRANWGARRTADFHAYLAPYTIIYPDERILEQYAFARFESLKVGIQIDPADAWIAATALALRCPLVTHTAADFAGVPNLKLITEQAP